MSRGIVEKILAKLQRLDEYLEYLKELGDYSAKAFVSDHRIYGLAERYLQLSIEIVLDVGRLVIIDLGAERPENNHEIFEILARRKVITRKLFSQLRGIAGFRNVLVHEYERIDRSMVYRNLQSGLKDLSVFKRSIVRYLAKK